MDNKQTSNIKVNTGKQSGVDVRADAANNRYLVEVSNDYDVFGQFTRKDRLADGSYGNPYATELKGDSLPSGFDAKNKKLFAIEIDRFATQDNITDFNRKVLYARQTTEALKSEREAIKSVAGFDLNNGKEPAFYDIGVPKKLDKESNTYKPSFVDGKVVHAGKFLFAVHTGENRDGQPAVQIIPSRHLLKGEELKIENREEAIASRIKVGDAINIQFNDKAYAEKIKPSVKLAKEQQQSQDQLLAEKVAALQSQKPDTPEKPAVKVKKAPAKKQPLKEEQHHDIPF